MDAVRRIWGERLRGLRLEQGHTQFTLAVAIGVTPSAVANWEQGRIAPTDLMKQRIAEALGTTPGELFAWPENGDGEAA